jgi:hypothetical protein
MRWRRSSARLAVVCAAALAACDVAMNQENVVGRYDSADQGIVVRILPDGTLVETGLLRTPAENQTNNRVMAKLRRTASGVELQLGEPMNISLGRGRDGK